MKYHGNGRIRFDVTKNYKNGKVRFDALIEEKRREKEHQQAQQEDKKFRDDIDRLAFFVESTPWKF